jgi:predicted RNA-binding Zn-ribbon protein involved in translation (DUF1610 family)
MSDTAPRLAADFELIRFDCPNCGKHIRATPGSAGKQFQCRNKACGATLTVPIPAQTGGNQKLSLSPRRRSPILPLAIAFGSIGINVIVIAAVGRDVANGTEDKGHASIPVVLADVESKPEEEGQATPPVILPEAESLSAAQAEPKKSPPVPPPGGAENPQMAFRSYLQLADAGDREAMYNVGLCYEKGAGVDQNSEEAAEWYEEAAKLGHVAAMYKIGLCYAVGKGVDKDEEIAAQWLNESTSAGHAEAKQALYLVKTGMPPVLAATWMSRPIGELPKVDHSPATTNQHSPPRLSAGERIGHQIQGINRLLGGAPKATDRQRDRFMRGTFMQRPSTAIRSH